MGKDTIIGIPDAAKARTTGQKQQEIKCSKCHNNKIFVSVYRDDLNEPWLLCPSCGTYVVKIEQDK